MTRKPEDDLDAVRKLILERAAELRLSLADLSRQIGKNDAYVQQFVWRGTPRRLPEPIRLTMADLLQVPEGSLRDGSTPAGGFPPATFRRVAGADELPVYVDGGTCDPREATNWTVRPLIIPPSGNAFGVWVRRDHGRVKPGDLLFACESQPPRHDDVAVLVKDNIILAIGNIDALEGDTATIDGTAHDLCKAKIFKVGAVKYA